MDHFPMSTALLRLGLSGYRCGVQAAPVRLKASGPA